MQCGIRLDSSLHLINFFNHIYIRRAYIHIWYTTTRKDYTIIAYINSLNTYLCIQYNCCTQPKQQACAVYLYLLKFSNKQDHKNWWFQIYFQAATQSSRLAAHWLYWYFIFTRYNTRSSSERQKLRPQRENGSGYLCKYTNVQHTASDAYNFQYFSHSIYLTLIDWIRWLNPDVVKYANNMK